LALRLHPPVSRRQRAHGAVPDEYELASGGYPWTVVPVEDRNPYLAVLDRASIDGDTEPLAGLIAERVRWSMEQKDERNPES
jgi:hypothetical protein